MCMSCMRLFEENLASELWLCSVLKSFTPKNPVESVVQETKGEMLNHHEINEKIHSTANHKPLLRIDNFMFDLIKAGKLSTVMTYANIDYFRYADIGSLFAIDDPRQSGSVLLCKLTDAVIINRESSSGSRECAVINFELVL